MRRLIAVTVASILIIPYASPALRAATAVTTAPVSMPPINGQSSTTAVLGWIFHYAEKPEPLRTPEAYLALSRNGALRDPEQAGVYLGFLAGVLGREGGRADRLLMRLSAGVAQEDHWLVVRALAYSGLPNWRDLMRRLEKRVPSRAGMIAAYLDGSMPALDRIAPEDAKPSKWAEFKAWFSEKQPSPHQPTFENSPELLDVLWGLYFATGETGPIERIVALSAWSKNQESINKLTIGNMAKYTLANNASRSPRLLALLKTMSANQPKDVAPILAEVVRSAEMVDTGYLRTDALAAIEELKRRGPGSRRNMALWGQVGETAIAAGCIGLAVSGVAAIVGLPCVIGGALSSAGVRMLSQP